MTKIKTIITAAIAALALTTASLAIPGQAFAGGHGHGGHGGHGHHGIGGGHFGHGLFGHGHHHHQPFLRLQQLLEMEPLRPGECLQPLLLISRRSEEEARPGREARASFRSDDRRSLLHDRATSSDPDEIGSGSAGLQSAGFRCELEPRFLLQAPRSLNAFALASHSMRAERNRQKKARVPMAASQMCDGPHIYRRAAGLGFNSRKVLWGDFARVSAAQTPFRHERSNRKRTNHVAHLKFPIDQSCRAPIIAIRISLRDFIGHGPGSCGRCLLPRRADQPQPCLGRCRVRPGNGHALRTVGASGR